MSSSPATDCLFAEPAQPATHETFAPDAVRLRARATRLASTLMETLERVIATAPLRHMVTPGGRRMSVRNTNAGTFGWVSDRSGYRYQRSDPETGNAWPAMPGEWCQLARAAASEAGFAGFAPDVCLINVYTPGTRLSLHQDRDERDFEAPIVSVSMGLPATFLFGGVTRQARTRRIALLHGDVLVWGGASRLAYHGIAPLAQGDHPLLGEQRVNLTFRHAG